MTGKIEKLCGSVLDTFHETPLVELGRICADLDGRILAKLEYLSPGFSKKDRIALQMVEEIGHPNFQTMLDCRSIHASAKAELPRVLNAALATGKLKHIHVNDPNDRGPGFGDLQFTPLLKILHEADYQGYISVEVFDFNPDPQTIAARSIGYLHGICESLGISTGGVRN